MFFHGVSIREETFVTDILKKYFYQTSILMLLINCNITINFNNEMSKPWLMG